MASLDRAVALSDGDDGAVRIGEHLYLDMAGPFEVALAEDGGVAERRLGLASGCRKGVLELVRRPDEAHAATAAAGRRLDQKRKADLLRLALRQHRHTRLGRDPLRCHLVASQAQRLRRRPDPGESRPLDGFREVSALGKESIAGVNGVGASIRVRRGRFPRRSRYVAMATVRAAARVWNAPSSSGAATATVSIPSRSHVRKMRTAISPRFATSSRAIALARIVEKP